MSLRWILAGALMMLVALLVALAVAAVGGLL